jgi:hypothetical protein
LPSRCSPARSSCFVGLAAIERQDRATLGIDPTGKTGSDWLIVAPEAAELEPLVKTGDWFELRVTAATPL